MSILLTTIYPVPRQGLPQSRLLINICAALEAEAQHKDENLAVLGPLNTNLFLQE